MIRFTDGTTVTFEEAAALIRAEPWGLTVWKLVDSKGHRCAAGVLMGSTRSNVAPKRVTLSSQELWRAMVEANNYLHGRPSKRREYMAQWFEAQEEE